MIETPHVTSSAAVPAAVIRIVVARDRMREVMGPGIQELMEAVAEQGRSPRGPLFTHHLRMDPETFDFELGVPVEGAVSGTGRVRPGELPEAKVARTIYQGPYEGLHGAWGELDRWIRDQGLPPASDLWERYVLGPESSPDPSAWRTELNRRLEG